MILKREDIIISVSFGMHTFFKQIREDLIFPSIELFLEVYTLLSYKDRAYAKLLGIGPELTQDLLVLRLKTSLLCSSFFRPVQANIIKVHLARTAGNSHIAFSTQAD